MPPRSTAVTLGFVGSGPAAPESISALLTDFVSANGGKARVIIPATEDHWNDSIAAVVDVAKNNSWPIEVVTDDSSTKFKPVKDVVAASSKQHKATDIAITVQKLTDSGAGSLVVFYDEDDETYKALEAAADAGTAMYDICDGMQPLEMKAPGDDQEEQPPDDQAQGEEMTLEWLASKSDNEIEAMCDELAIAPENFDTWDDVRQAIFEQAQGGGGGAAPPASDEDNPWPDRKEIEEEWDFGKLKEFAVANEVEVPANSKTTGYRNAVLAWYDNAMAQAGALEDEEREFQAPEGGDGGDWYSKQFDEIKAMILSLDRNVTEALTGIRETLQNGSRPAAAPAERPPGTTVKKAAAPAAAPAKRTTAARPAVAAKKAAAPAPRTVGRR